MLISFIYLGGVILAADENSPAVIRNIAKARAVWRNMINILSREGARLRLYIFFFKICCLVSVTFLCGDVGGYPLHEMVPRGVPGPGDAATYERLLRRRGGRSGIKPPWQRQERRRGLRKLGRTSENS